MEKRRFVASEATTYRDLQAVLRKMGATSLHVGQEFATGEYEIVFDRAGVRYVFRCAKWRNPADNLRAAQRTISLLYAAMEEYGTTRIETALPNGSKTTRPDPFDSFFLAFRATPDDTVLLLGDGTRPWWEVLGVSQTANRAEIRNAYLALAKVHHPDVGGTVEDFKRLRRAYDSALAAQTNPRVGKEPA